MADGSVKSAPSSIQATASPAPSTRPSWATRVRRIPSRIISSISSYWSKFTSTMSSWWGSVRSWFSGVKSWFSSLYSRSSKSKSTASDDEKKPLIPKSSPPPVGKSVASVDPRSPSRAGVARGVATTPASARPPPPPPPPQAAPKGPVVPA
ncbi:hypothetical protein QFC24_002162 [Naganishia onofrii]|uniref:Uncharacterized protein n=1 Tax=Naganishia onofrii TaxID=1851511 RepID=A0ACC2XUR0_9TREE|nr:hypothetical protein QFC24_002162 [Naganishia onofrii]